MSIRDVVYGPGADAPFARARPKTRGAVSAARALSRVRGMALATAVGALVFIRARVIWAPEGDSALHYKLIEDIARTHSLPTALPHNIARIEPGGTIANMFPYAYTPLFHLTGAAAYILGGSVGVSLIGAIAASIIAAVVYSTLARRLPWYVASSCVIVGFLPPTTLAVFTHVYMEPMMLALVFAGAWFYYVAMAARRPRYSLLAGALLGLAVGTRQVALIYVFVIAVATLVYLAERQCWRPQRLSRELPWLLAATAAFLVVAAPFLVYLAAVNGTIGYADLALPGTAPKLAIDPVANAYIANITKPHLSALAWLSRYRATLLYSERWLPEWYAALPFLFFVPGVTYLENRGGGARFYARLAAVQVIVEMALFAVVHGNDRYVIASRFLFYSILPVGVFALSRGVFDWCRARNLRLQRAPAAVVAMSLAAILGSSLVGATYANYVTDSQDLLAFRSRSYAEMGAWVNANTPRDAVILVPRTYTAELTWDRDVTWVTFFGNAWVVDAISTPDAGKAHEILRKYGVDYVLVADPPGLYLDRVPKDGMRAYLQLGQDDSRYFTLVNVTEDAAGLTVDDQTTTNGLRLYRVNGESVVSR